MSFEKLEKEDLLKIAEEFGVEVNDKARPATLARAIVDDGVTLEMAKKTLPELAEKIDAAADAAKADDAAKKADETQILVKMERANRTFQIRGVTFTQDNPFALMAESDALWVVKNVEGMRRADPEEAAEFYG